MLILKESKIWAKGKVHVDHKEVPVIKNLKFLSRGSFIFDNF
jgi:hypothetical protein